MIDVMGIIYTSMNDLRLRELTTSRAVAALPVVGRYRMIDFVLSSLVNSGIRNVGVIMQKNYHSLMDHLGSGKEWDLHTRNDGLFILPPFLTRENVGTYGGILDAIRSNMGYLRRSDQEYVILTNSHTAYNIQFDDLIQYHVDNGADVTLMYAKTPIANLDIEQRSDNRQVYLEVDPEGMIVDLELNTTKPTTDDLYMDVLIMRRDLLRYLVEQAYTHGMSDFNRDVLQRYIHSGVLKFMGYEHKGYSRRICSIQSYYKFNMEMLDGDIRQELFGKNPIYTKVRDEVPAKYLQGANAYNSLVADGCIIEGRVENSVLFRAVRVGKGAIVKNSIIMQDSEIQAGAEVENVIFDKQCTIRSNGRLIGQPSFPIVVGKGTVL